MARKEQDTNLMLDMKKDRLEKHLAEVEELIREWIAQLDVRDPFQYHERLWGWQSVYQPIAERDPDNNHILRHHIKKRQLWSHHAAWEINLNKVWELMLAIREVAQKKMVQKIKAEGKDYTADYLNTALLRGFELACKDTPIHTYQSGIEERGVQYGTWQIEQSCSSKREYEDITKGHQHFSFELSELKEMEQIVEVWEDVKRYESSMKALAEKALKTNDYLRTCQFCRNLWKV